MDTRNLFAKANLPLTYRALAGGCMIAWLAILHLGNLYREDAYHSFLGQFPSFAATAALIFLIPAINQLPTGNRAHRAAKLIGLGTVWHAAYEFVLYLDGRTYDWLDNLAAFLGGVLGWVIFEWLLRDVLPFTE